MITDNKPQIVAVMLMGKRVEPFLEPCLESIKDAVDLLILNDNSRSLNHQNMETVKSSSLYKNNRVIIIPSEFMGFGPCRNLCLDYIKENLKPGVWVLYIDTDEVHPPGINEITRAIIPELPNEVGIVDGYKYEFFQSQNYYLSIDRRHNMIFRYNADVRWEGKIHERPVNLNGLRVALPYIYFHYGFLSSPQLIIDKWSFYGSLNDSQCSAMVESSTGRFVGEAGRVLNFSKKHPICAEKALKMNFDANKEAVLQFEDDVKKNGQNFFSGKLAEFNYSLRVSLRNPEFQVRFLFSPPLIKGLKAMIRANY